MGKFDDYTDAALEESLQELGKARADAEAGFVEQMNEVAAEIESRHAAAKVAKLVEGLSPEELRLIKQVKISDLGGPADGADEQEG